MVSTYILIDTTLIGYPINKPWIKNTRKPSWVATLYGREAVSVSPILIDIERAMICNRINAVMALVNALFPQLGVSFIDTELTFIQLLEHLRQFICIRTEDNVELTLRFADCVVLAALSTTLTSAQWAAIVGPFQRWKIHGRDGNILSLPVVKSEVDSALPLLLSNAQIVSLKNEMAGDQLLANLRKMRPSDLSYYSTSVAHRHAENVRRIWLSNGRDEDANLLLFVRDVLETNGRLLSYPGLTDMLAQSDSSLVRKDMDRIVRQFLARR